MPVELALAEGGMHMEIVATDQRGDTRTAHHRWLNFLIRSEISAVAVNPLEEACGGFRNIGFVHGKTPDVGSQAQFSPASGM